MSSSRARSAAGAALLAAAALALAHDAPPSLPTVVERDKGRVEVEVNFTDAFPPDLGRTLENGLTNVIAEYFTLVPAGEDEPAAVYSRELDVLYDVWEETYHVTEKDPDHPKGMKRVFRDLPALLAFLDDGGHVDLAPAALLDARTWTVVTRVELNPVSKELLEKTREFIAGGGPRMQSRSVLGAMASYLLKDADPGVESHVFRSPPFKASEVKEGAGGAP